MLAALLLWEAGGSISFEGGALDLAVPGSSAVQVGQCMRRRSVKVPLWEQQPRAAWLAY
jgi:hypothetical protein